MATVPTCWMWQDVSSAKAWPWKQQWWNSKFPLKLWFWGIGRVGKPIGRVGLGRWWKFVLNRLKLRCLGGCPLGSGRQIQGQNWGCRLRNSHCWSVEDRWEKMELGGQIRWGKYNKLRGGQLFKELLVDEDSKDDKTMEGVMGLDN